MNEFERGEIAGQDETCQAVWRALGRRIILQSGRNGPSPADMFFRMLVCLRASQYPAIARLVVIELLLAFRGKWRHIGGGAKTIIPGLWEGVTALAVSSSFPRPKPAPDTGEI